MESLPAEFKVELRLNNTIFKCAVDGRHYNIKDKRAYAVQMIKGLIPEPVSHSIVVNVEDAILCEDCYKKKDMHLIEPSKIVVPDLSKKGLKGVFTLKA